MSRFIHPTHARGVCSKMPSGLDNGPLTDRKIKRYALAGVYGTTAQQRELDRVPSKKRKRATQTEWLLKQIADLLS